MWAALMIKNDHWENSIRLQKKGDCGDGQNEMGDGDEEWVETTMSIIFKLIMKISWNTTEQLKRKHLLRNQNHGIKTKQQKNKCTQHTFHTHTHTARNWIQNRNH